MKGRGQPPADNTLEVAHSSTVKLLSRSQLAELGSKQEDKFYNKVDKSLTLIRNRRCAEEANGNGHERQQG